MSSVNSKQQHTRQSVQKTGEDVEIFSLEENIRTYITHNKGGKWELIKAPEKNIDG
jgi:hypothetical protein